jgi:hypothetical protein
MWALDLAHDLAHVHDFTGDLDLAPDRCLHLIRQLAEAPVDVSGADLSSEDFRDLDVLEDVVWTPETIWPPGGSPSGCSCDRGRSGRGIYQVRGHGERDPLSQVTVLPVAPRCWYSASQPGGNCIWPPSADARLSAGRWFPGL